MATISTQRKVAACIIILAMLLILVALIIFVTLSFTPEWTGGTVRDNGKIDGGGRDGDKDGDNDTDDVDIGSNEILPGGGFERTTVQPVYGSKNLTIVFLL